MAAIYSNGGNRWSILGFNFTKRDALSSVYKISMFVPLLTKHSKRAREPRARLEWTLSMKILISYGLYVPSRRSMTLIKWTIFKCQLESNTDITSINFDKKNHFVLPKFINIKHSKQTSQYFTISNCKLTLLISLKQNCLKAHSM
jgi:hypothetical protein